MTMKSFILGSAAAVLAVTGAQAADLPAAEPVEYVKVCDTFGTGFFYIPGTETCLKIGGYARYELAFREPIDPAARTEHHTLTRARADVKFDARTMTEYGLLRTFIEMHWTEDSGGGVGTSLERAFIQFGGLTAGRAATFFDYGAGFQLQSTVDGGPLGPVARTILAPTNLLAYTFAFGNGFSATLSVEDGSFSRGSVLAINGAWNATAAAAADADYYGGHTLPDVVAQVRVDQGWGFVSLAGVVHNVRTRIGGVATSATTFAAAPIYDEDSKLGWAVKGDLQVNLPMIAAGDAFKAGAAYSEGAVTYVGARNYGNIGVATADVLDGAFDPATGSLKLAKAWSAYAGFKHFWTPQIWTAITGGYTSVNNPSFLGSAADWDVATVFGTVGYSPVSNLLIAAEVGYEKLDVHSTGTLPGEAVGGDRDAISGTLRIQSSF